MKSEVATLANGCFWCSEAIFARLKGVKSVLPSYSGGSVEDPTYDEVSTGTTGHAETAQIEFDPSIISFEKLLEVYYVAEDYHKKYYEQHQSVPYCRFVIEPKIHKLLKKYGKDIKPEYS